MGEQIAILDSLERPRVRLVRVDPPWIAEYLEASERAEERVNDPHADRTRRTYAHAWRQWAAHCAALEFDPLPVVPRRLCSYLELLSRSRAPNTVRLALSALVSLDQAWRVQQGEGEALSLRKHPRVQRWLKGWSRDHAKAPRTQAPALSVAEIDAMLSAAAEPARNLSAAQHVALYTRDRALLLLGVCGAMRCSELAELGASDVQHVDRGLRVLIRRSKTDQNGAGHLRGLSPQARIARCPVEAHRAWMAIRGAGEGPLYLPIARSGLVQGRALTVRQVQEIVTTRARAAGITASSHSLRASFATLAFQRGRPLNRIADQGGWRSLDTLRGYVRQASLFDDNASSGLLDL
jgi:integrase